VKRQTCEIELSVRRSARLVDMNSATKPDTCGHVVSGERCIACKTASYR